MTPSWRRGMPLLVVMAILIGIGWVMVFSASGIMGMAKRDTGLTVSVFRHLARQMVATGLGAAAIWWLVRQPIAGVERWAFHALAGSVVLMLSVFIPGLGHTVGKATRWLAVGPLSFQPVEVFKLVVVACYAVLLAGMRPGEKWSGDTWLKLGGLALLSALLPLLQRDYGSALLLMVLGMAMIWIAGGDLRYLAVIALVCAGIGAIGIVIEPYRMKRIAMYLSGGGYQANQSLIALGAGGLTGVGLGESTQKLFYLPSSHADFIYAILCEELGFLFGGLPVIALYVFLLRGGTGIARMVNGRMPYLLASGMTMLIFMQAMWHIAVVLVLVPTKGLALPFVSYGGSSLIASMMAVGIILRCAAEPATERTRGEIPAGAGAWAPS